jgi:hypothetical protein
MKCKKKILTKNMSKKTGEDARKGTNAHLECKKTFITETRKGISNYVEETQRFGMKP